MTKILSIVPEGSRVVKNQLVCELDAAPLRDQLLTRGIIAKQADAALDNAKFAREAAEIAEREYDEGIYPKELRAAQNAIKLAQSAIAVAEVRLKRIQVARTRLDALLAGQGGPKTPADIAAELEVADRLDDAERSVDRVRTDLEVAQDNRHVLMQFTQDKMVKRLRHEVEEARSIEVAKRSVLELARAVEQKLVRQVALCKILAPGDGLLRFAANQRSGAPQIKEGAEVRERQTIFSVEDLDAPLRVNVKVHKSFVDRVTPGRVVRITIDALPGPTFAGTVTSVAPLPDPMLGSGGGSKAYIVNVSFTEKHPKLRPGLTALVEIIVPTLDDAVAVPVRALVHYDNKAHVAVEVPGRAVEWREVTLGLNNGEMIEVQQGLKPGEQVATDPLPLLSEEQRSKVNRPLIPAKVPLEALRPH